MKPRNAGDFDFGVTAIDPGAKVCAVAGFSMAHSDGGRLVWIGSVPLDWACYSSRAVVEIPERVNVAGASADDLIRVAVAGARMAERCVRGAPGSVTEVRPAEWKGSVPKPICHRRVLGALRDEELALIGGNRTVVAVDEACARGAADRWGKDGKRYYRASEFPKVGDVKITHDILDAVALGMWYVGRYAR